jgi:pSer/pThr/pTyr-binding forkhead associated (FHA) protein
LPSSWTIVLGRGEEATLRIDDPAMSRRHTALHLAAPWTIEDLGSSNGILL